jgi:isopenicillin N synthase-like dioxygenase
MSANIPLLDLAVWRSGSEVQRRELAARLDSALRESGFLMVTNHGVPDSLKSDIRKHARHFFEQPEVVKHNYATPVSGRGWIGKGREANAYYGEKADAARADLKETYTSGRVFSTGDPLTDATWFAPNVWPAEVPGLGPLCDAYTAALEQLNTELLEICATALGLAPDWFTIRSSHAPYDFNVTRYPAWTQTGDAVEGQFRIAPHTDWGVLTFLDRQPGYAGLQILTLDGDWADAPYAPGAFTINVGDLLARWTGDRWRSTRHRVLPPSPEAPNEELISLVVFFEANMDAIIEPLAPPVGGGCTYPAVTAADYRQERVKAATVA